MLIPPRRNSLSGGGILGITHIGALEVLEERGLLRCVREYLGVSAGSMLAFTLSLGYTIAEIRELNFGLDYTLIQNLDPENMFLNMESYGIDNGQNFDKLLGIVLKAKGLPLEITFAEFAAKFPDRPLFRTYATDLQTCLGKEFSLRATPDTPLKFAVQASACIPFLFTPVKDPSGNMFNDGGSVSNTPFQYLTDSERAETLSLTFNLKDKSGDTSQIMSSFFNYFQRMFISAYVHQDMALHEAWGHHIMYLETNDTNPFHLKATPEEKMELYELGRKSAARFLETRAAKRLTRRNSLS